jgi:hypothetical protein
MTRRKREPLRPLTKQEQRALNILGILPQTVRLADGGEETFGNFLAIEVKKPGEQARADQETFLQDIRDRGGIGLCVHSLRELEEQLRPFLLFSDASQKRGDKHASAKRR